MKIYHYTNIDTLALILKNRTIRFNRLDKVDDVEEGSTHSKGIRFSKYTFVSCWTEEEEESIPLWKMYGGDKGGVRIALQREMFKMYRVSDLDLGKEKANGYLNTFVPAEDMVKPEFFFMPTIDYNGGNFYRKVKYVDDVWKYVKDAVVMENLGNGSVNFNMKMLPFGMYKNKRWNFQNESRFVLYAFPFNPLVIGGNNPELSNIIIKEFMANKPLPFTYYDLHLRDEVVEQMEITLSPSVTEGQRIIVKALVDKFAPQVVVKESSIGQLVRLK